jgi:hypothetical protein
MTVAAPSRKAVAVLLVILGVGVSPRRHDTTNEDGTLREWSSAKTGDAGSAIEEAWSLALQAMGAGCVPTNHRAYALLELMAIESSNQVIRLMAASCLGLLSEEDQRWFEFKIHFLKIAQDPEWLAFESAKHKLWISESLKWAEKEYHARGETWMQVKWKRNQKEEIIGMDIIDVPANFTTSNQNRVHATNDFTTPRKVAEVTRTTTTGRDLIPLADREGRSARTIFKEEYDAAPTGGRSGITPDAERELDAFDCNRPAHMRVVRTDHEGSCGRNRPQIKKQDHQQYLLLQRVPYGKIRTKKCLLNRNSIPLYCGNYDHQTVLTPDVRFNSPVPLTREECQELHESREYIVRTQPEEGSYEDKVFSLTINATNQVSYDSFGQTYISGTEVQCVGTKWVSPSAQMTVANVIEWRGDNLELKEELALLDDNDGMTLFEEQYRLPTRCSVGAGFCKTNKGTWFWDQPQEKEKCRLYTARKVNGTEITVLDEGKVAAAFIDEERMIRLVLRKKVRMCGREVISTNYKDLFLYSGVQDTLLS